MKDLHEYLSRTGKSSLDAVTFADLVQLEDTTPAAPAAGPGSTAAPADKTPAAPQGDVAL